MIGCARERRDIGRQEECESDCKHERADEGRAAEREIGQRVFGHRGERGDGCRNFKMEPKDFEPA